MDLQFEIDQRHEDAGWIECYLTCDGIRHTIDASDVFPPFATLLYFLRAIAAQRLPDQFYWDEEGHGVHFEAQPLAADSPNFHLRIVSDMEDKAWVDAELDRKMVVDIFLAALRDYVKHARFPSRGPWNISKKDIQELENLLSRPIPSRLDPSAVEPVRFIMPIPNSKGFTSHGFSIWFMAVPILKWWLPGDDPFWRDWFAFLETIASTTHVVELNYIDRQMVTLIEGMVGSGELPAADLENSWRFHFRAEPVEDPQLFHLAIHETDLEYHNFLIMDEILDRRQFVSAFCTTFDEYLRKCVNKSMNGKVSDLVFAQTERVSIR